MKVNPIFKFALLVLLVLLPTLIGVFGCIFTDWDNEKVAGIVILVYMVGTLFILLLAFLWVFIFEDSYDEWKKLQEKNINKRANHDKEMKRMKEEMEEMRRRLDDRWDNF